MSAFDCTKNPIMMLGTNNQIEVHDVILANMETISSSVQRLVHLMLKT
jgi:hypothetical protein